MICKVESCNREAAYKKDAVCQMHYFRMMRTGSYEKKIKSRKGLFETPNGYIRIFSPNHQLADKDGYVLEHRKVLFDVIGDIITKCEICQKPWKWGGKKNHVDHIDGDKKNNSIENLRPLCNGCNSSRKNEIEYMGKKMNAEAWSREIGGAISANTIKARIRAGWNMFDVLNQPLQKGGRVSKFKGKAR